MQTAAPGPGSLLHAHTHSPGHGWQEAEKVLSPAGGVGPSHLLNSSNEAG